MNKMTFESGNITCTMSVDMEDMNIYDVFDILIRPVLIGVGYHEDTVSLLDPSMSAEDHEGKISLMLGKAGLALSGGDDEEGEDASSFTYYPSI